MNYPSTPNESYKKMQRELRLLSESGAQPGQRTKLEKALEKMFVAAWGFTSDRLRLSYKLQCRLRTSNGGLDHCKHYTSDNDQRVIVTQPYGNFGDQLRADFTLDNGIAPELFEATEWAFYYPGHASLIVLIFPSDYVKIMDECNRKRPAGLAPA